MMTASLFSGYFGATDAVTAILSISVGYSLIRRQPDDPTRWIPVDTLTYVRWAAGFAFIIVTLATGQRENSTPYLVASAGGTVLMVAGCVFFYGAKSPLSSIFVRKEDLVYLKPKGFYRLSRQPVFFGLMLIAAGFALTLVSLTGLLLCVLAVFPLLIYSARKVDETWRLRAGSAYANYSTRVPLIFPWPGGK